MTTTTTITDAAGTPQAPLPSAIAHDHDHLEYTPPRHKERTAASRQPAPRRPYVRVFPKIWDRGQPTETEGIALAYGNTIVAHLIPSEARELADTLVDMAEQLENQTRGEEHAWV